MSARYPQLEPLASSATRSSEMRLEELIVGADGRNRVYLSPFGAKTGRNAPSNTGFIFGPATWLRSLIRPEPGRALAYIDWSSQEIAVAAALSGDERLLEALRVGDPYIAFAVLAGLAPAGATKQTHPEPRRLQDRDARQRLWDGRRPHGRAHRSVKDRGERSAVQAEPHVPDAVGMAPEQRRSRLASRSSGDRVRLANAHPSTTRTPTLLNFPVQANSAEMMRIACCLATEAGVRGVLSGARRCADRGVDSRADDAVARPRKRRWPRRRVACWARWRSAPT